MDQSGKRKPLDPISSKARLAQFSGSLDMKVGAAVETVDVNNQNWPQAILLCGSNAFNQLSADYGELMTANLSHLPHPSIHGAMEIIQMSCSGNQTAALVATEQPPVFPQSTKATPESGEGGPKRMFQYHMYLWGSGKSSSQMRVPVSLPAKCNIAQLSCGHSHVGFVTERGQAFTWGSGEYGMLGHGTKSAVAEPKRVEGLKQFVCTAISCGAFHTAFIACTKEDVSYIRLPHRESRGAGLGVGYAGAKLIQSEECAAGGSLYMCGLGKAGQLGVGAEKVPNNGANAGCLPRPTLVSFFESENARVIKVSCGFHHTLAIAVPKQALRVFSPSVYSFGYGEHGRLGLGDEDQVSLPHLVQFPAPFHPTQISAGEQHSVALGHEGCYSWGSNDMGQLGVGNPGQMEFALTPQKIQIPEGMVVRKIAAGGRHTAAITYCANLLTWGWGEEGQLGHGTEKSAYLPRPCKISSVFETNGVPMDLSLGGTHTVVVVHNPKYISPVFETPSPPAPTLVAVVEPKPEPEIAAPEPEPVPEPIIEPKIDILRQSIEAPEIVSLPPVEHKPPMIAEDDDYSAEEETPVVLNSTPVPPPPIRGLKDILQQREERKAAQALWEAEHPPAPKPEPVREPTPEPVVVVALAPEPEPVEEDEPEPVATAPVMMEATTREPAPEGSSLFNNIAKRAEMRKSKKEAAPPTVKLGFASSSVKR